MPIVRYAYDFVIGVQYRDDDVRLRESLEKRLALHGLTLHPSKTRLLEFDRFAMANRTQRGAGRPESFDFLGFTHCCATRRSDGKFALRRLSIAKPVRAFLQRNKLELKLRYARSIAWQGSWLGGVVRGYFPYPGIPGNLAALYTVWCAINRMWLCMLRRRSQRHDVTWQRFTGWVRRWIPSCRVIHPYPNQRLAFQLNAGARCANCAGPDLCGRAG